LAEKQQYDYKYSMIQRPLIYNGYEKMITSDYRSRIKLYGRQTRRPHL